MSSKAYHAIQELMDNFNEETGNEFELCKEIQKIYLEDGKPEDCQQQYAMALGYMGQAWYYGWNDLPENEQMAFPLLLSAYNEGNMSVLEDLGLCYNNGSSNPAGTPEPEKALVIWKKGMELGDRDCTFHVCVDKVENDQADAETIAMLEDLTEDYPNACAVLYYYYNREGDEDKAWEWREKAVEKGSSLMQSWIDEEAEQEVGEDDYSAPEHRRTDMSIFFGDSEDDDDDDEFDGYDDETEAAHPGYPEVGEKYVIIAATDDSFRIVQADAADWRSLPALIGAERCDDMRCQKFRDVAHKLMLPGTLLGQLDKDAFRKPHLELNYHASQWYDGMADLSGAMVICMEDNLYNPFSFTSKEQAQSVIDALCKNN